MNLIRNALMTSATIQKTKDYEPGIVGLNLQQQEMKRHRNWLKNPLFLSGTLLVWVAFMGYMKPRSERVSFAEHRFRLFMQASSFVFVITCATIAEYYQRRKEAH